MNKGFTQAQQRDLVHGNFQHVWTGWDQNDPNATGIAMHSNYLMYTDPAKPPQTDSGLFDKIDDLTGVGGAPRPVHTDSTKGWSHLSSYRAGE